LIFTDETFLFTGLPILKTQIPAYNNFIPNIPRFISEIILSDKKKRLLICSQHNRCKHSPKYKKSQMGKFCELIKFLNPLFVKMRDLLYYFDPEKICILSIRQKPHWRPFAIS